MTRWSRGYETVDSATRAMMLSRCDNRCQVCGEYGPPQGPATLHVHHLQRGPDLDDAEEHDPVNLSVACRLCHSWIHHRPMPSDAPVSLQRADLDVLLPHDFLILRVLDEIGPASFSEVYPRVKVLLSESAVRERLWVLQGLDGLADERSDQVVDQDAVTRDWGYPAVIETSARGHIPDDPALLLQRAEDELVRRALARGCDRSAVSDAFGITERATFQKEYRAYAYAFPLDEFSRGGRPRGQSQSSVPDELRPVETWGTPEGADGSVTGVAVEDVLSDR